MEKKTIQITSGRGPAECAWVVAQVLKKIIAEAQEFGLKHRIVHREPGDENGTLKTASIELKGDKLEAFLQGWVGTIQWIGQSEFRKLHKRKNWFIGINILGGSADEQVVNDADIRYEFTRSGGPGGQHVNKVSTAVRATHIPTGEVAFSSDGRSQLQNRTEARRKLLLRLEEKALQDQEQRAREEWTNHDEPVRGNPVRIFKGSDFKPNRKPKKFKAERKKGKQDLAKDDDMI